MGIPVKFIVYVPATPVESVRQALASVGVGEGITDGPQGKCYSDSFFQGFGEGIFRPLQGANPAIGKIGELTRVEEVKLESIVAEAQVGKALRTLRKVHPYEEPAYDINSLKNAAKAVVTGVFGYLKEPVKLEKNLLQMQNLFQNGSPLIPEAKPEN